MPLFPTQQAQLPADFTQLQIDKIKALPDGQVAMHVQHEEHGKTMKILSRKQIDLKMEIINELNDLGIQGKIIL